MKLVFSESEKQKNRVYLQRKRREIIHTKKYPKEVDAVLNFIGEMLKDFEPDQNAPKRSLPTVEMLQE